MKWEDILYTLYSYVLSFYAHAGDSCRYSEGSTWQSVLALIKPKLIQNRKILTKKQTVFQKNNLKKSLNHIEGGIDTMASNTSANRTPLDVSHI